MNKESLNNFYIMKPMEVGFHSGGSFCRSTPFRMCREDDPELLLWNRVVKKLCENYEYKKDIEVESGPPAFHCRFSHFFGVKDNLLQTLYIKDGYEPYVNGLNFLSLSDIDNNIT